MTNIMDEPTFIVVRYGGPSVVRVAYPLVIARKGNGILRKIDYEVRYRCTKTHTDDESALFNPYCTSHTLTEWIRKKCKCDDDITIDLVDLEGQVKNLPTRPKEYANEMVTGRETYILIRVERCTDGKFNYTSLLNNLSEINPELHIKLSSMSRPTTRTSKNNKKQKPQAKQIKAVRQESSQGKRPGSSEKPKKTGK